MKKTIIIGLVAIILISIGYLTYTKINLGFSHEVGDKIDSLNGVYVYYNGSIANVEGRNFSKDGYNLGLKYQCVEFVKRYYYEYLKHKMPDSYGHAKDFYNPSIKDGAYNKKRDLLQFQNPSTQKPKENDLLIYSGNPYGHVAIVSAVMDSELEIIQQNPGRNSPSRVIFKISRNNNLWKIENDRILGWLRKK